ncbi:MAG: hypothetical protein KKB91_09805 [Proteobacteria bacterium]|nr:hypothetical protein [Desulfocapsa sp.]MBU3944359.1 hypothetical protein [Pseudomonadota bacterium]MBU3983830.1 hypothetical protein [Pseudomonadota bacterium]MBU4029874.1 hypothetical protein [Pseudomonadota bacterium]MBU4043024.1 hypothetical protein [Pseudomonadota bacterium]
MDANGVLFICGEPNLLYIFDKPSTTFKNVQH